MKKYVSIEIVNCGMGSSVRFASVYVREEEKESTYTQVSYEEGLRELAKLARLLHKAPQLNANWHDPAISYRLLQGFVTE